MGCAEAAPEAQAPATARLVEAVRFELRFVHLVYCVLANKKSRNENVDLGICRLLLGCVRSTLVET